MTGRLAIVRSQWHPFHLSSVPPSRGVRRSEIGRSTVSRFIRNAPLATDSTEYRAQLCDSASQKLRAGETPPFLRHAQSRGHVEAISYKEVRRPLSLPHLKFSAVNSMTIFRTSSYRIGSRLHIPRADIPPSLCRSPAVRGPHSRVAVPLA